MYIASNGIKTAVVLYDEEPMNPRSPGYQDNITAMTCWHRRYNLGDEHGFASPRDFLIDMSEKHVSYPEFFRFVQDGGAWQLRLEEVRPVEAGTGDPKYVLECRDGEIGDAAWMSTGCLVSEDLQRISGPGLDGGGLLDYLDRRELEGLLDASESVLVKPLYLYDHNGITISTGSFIGRALHAEWDSGQVGYIHMDKETAMRELAMPTENGYAPLSDENWKERAEQYIGADVQEYDNYLRGEVYGYQTYDGLEECDSCWGFNPGEMSIEQLMKEELGSWFGPGLEFECSSDLDFDIDDYFETHGFPELRERIWSAVFEHLDAVEGEAGPYPFEAPLEELRANKDGVLTDLVSEIYDEHVEPTPERVREALEAHAGISREVKPKLTAAGLKPGRDYTIEELAALARKKAAERSPIKSAAPKERSAPEAER